MNNIIKMQYRNIFTGGIRDLDAMYNLKIYKTNFILSSLLLFFYLTSDCARK